MNLTKPAISLLTLGLLICSSTYAQLYDSIQSLYQAEKYEELIQLTDSLIAVQEDFNHRPEIYAMRADAYYYIGELELSLKDYLNTLQYADQSDIQYQSLVQETHSYIGFCYREFHFYERALPHFQRSLEMAQDLNDTVEIATSYYNLGSVFRDLGQLDQSLTMLQKAYQIDVARKDTSALGFDLTLMTSLEVELGDLDKALAYAKESLELLREEGGNANSKAIRYKLIGLVFTEKQQYDSAQAYLEEAMVLFQDARDSLRHMDTQLALAELDLKQGRYDQASQTIQQLQQELDMNQSADRLAKSNLILAEAYIKQNFYVLAQNVLENNLILCQEAELMAEARDSYELLAELYEQQGKERMVLMTKEKMLDLRDSITAINNREELRKMELIYQFDQMEHENELLKLQNEKAQLELEARQQRITLLTIILVLSILSSIAIIAGLISRFRMKKKLLQAEINELRMQIRVVLKGDTSALDLQALNEKLNRSLSEREIEILQHAISDLSNTAIADKVCVSVNTVKYHLKNIYDKLGVSNRKEAMEFVVNTK
ncbi:tetratricopeptide repeat protein [Reichenbachiella ulvae]|uniref:Tetratricopeptide repeat protein n=1 Tax=Reichenbachiella ulvae TaxID=2980104 RepID=A0ABT3CRX5_9BACT|nr:tetratricopeptide repeat protein [Reichenbachiella ulvae]MCV9386372.1 tetratricopeptide repeat protein [Reichenbachiella ulvae]